MMFISANVPKPWGSSVSSGYLLSRNTTEYLGKLHIKLMNASLYTPGADPGMQPVAVKPYPRIHPAWVILMILYNVE